MKIILLDIEGTTTPIDFVHKRLFPFAKERIDSYVAENFDALKPEIKQLYAEYKRDFSDQIYGRDFRADAPGTVSEYLKFLIGIDRKSTPLKTIQGRIWQKGYESGELQSEVFDDVPPAFERWKKAGKTVAIYSSGSRLAQEMLFRYTNFGDLTSFISAYFDTETGPKKDKKSYEKIAEILQTPESGILFISDVPEELDAARRAGFETRLCIRDGNAPVKEDHGFQTVLGFDVL